MGLSESSEVGLFLRLLQERGLTVGDHAGAPTVARRGRDGPETAIDLPEPLLVAYLDRLGRSHAPFDDDPRSVARGLLAVQLADDLTADHGSGVNRVRRVALVDGAEGPELVEQRTDDPGPSPADGPHDDPTVFAAELEALAGFLRDQGLDAVAAPDEAALRVSGEGIRDVVTVELRPDLYRRWFEATQEEYEAIGGEPREHAWRLWCRMVAMLSVRSPGARVALVESSDGEVLLRPEEDGPPLAWSADPGS